MAERRRHLRLSLPFTIVPADNAVHLVAGEDLRFTLTGPGFGEWGAAFLARWDERSSVTALLEAVAPEHRPAAEQLVAQLVGERVLVEATPAEAPERVSGSVRVIGEGPLAQRVRRQLTAAAAGAEPALHVFCQDTLEERGALDFNRERLSDGVPWLWVSSGPLARAYVGPVFLPWRGPCFGCLVAAFDRLTSAPEVRRALQAHAASGHELRPAQLPDEATELLAQLVSWKLGACGRVEAPPAAFRLHVLELASFELSTHGVPVDPDCNEHESGSRRP